MSHIAFKNPYKAILIDLDGEPVEIRIFSDMIDIQCCWHEQGSGGLFNLDKDRAKDLATLLMEWAEGRPFSSENPPPA